MRKLRADDVFLIAGGVLLVAAIFSKRYLSISIRDDYFVILKQHYIAFWASVLILYSLLYYLLRSNLRSSLLTWSHTVVTVLMALLLVGIPGLHYIPSESVYVSTRPGAYQWAANVFYFSLGLFIVAQVLFIVNLVGGLMRRSSH